MITVSHSTIETRTEIRRNPEFTVENSEKIIAAPHAASKIEIKIM